MTMRARIGLVLCAFALSFLGTRWVSGTDRDDRAGLVISDEAVLDIMLDGPDLFVDFDASAISVLGFDHAPSNRREHDAMVIAHRLLDSDRLIALPAAAQCRLTESFASVGHGYDDLCSAGAALIDGGDSVFVANHTHWQPINSTDSQAVESVSARWSWVCDSPEALHQVDVQLFDAFDELDGVDAQVDLPNVQMEATLTRV